MIWTVCTGQYGFYVERYLGGNFERTRFQYKTKYPGKKEIKASEWGTLLVLGSKWMKPNERSLGGNK